MSGEDTSGSRRRKRRLASSLRGGIIITSDRINHMMMAMMMAERINCCYECSRYFRTAAILKSSRLAGTFGLKLKVSCTFLQNLSV